MPAMTAHFFDFPYGTISRQHEHALDAHGLAFASLHGAASNPYLTDLYIKQPAPYPCCSHPRLCVGVNAQQAAPYGTPPYSTSACAMPGPYPPHAIPPAGPYSPTPAAAGINSAWSPPAAAAKPMQPATGYPVQGYTAPTAYPYHYGPPPGASGVHSGMAGLVSTQASQGPVTPGAGVTPPGTPPAMAAGTGAGAGVGVGAAAGGAPPPAGWMDPARYASNAPGQPRASTGTSYGEPAPTQAQAQTQAQGQTQAQAQNQAQGQGKLGAYPLPGSAPAGGAGSASGYPASSPVPAPAPKPMAPGQAMPAMVPGPIPYGPPPPGYPGQALGPGMGAPMMGPMPHGGMGGYGGGVPGAFGMPGQHGPGTGWAASMHMKRQISCAACMQGILLLLPALVSSHGCAARVTCSLHHAYVLAHVLTVLIRPCINAEPLQWMRHLSMTMHPPPTHTRVPQLLVPCLQACGHRSWDTEAVWAWVAWGVEAVWGWVVWHWAAWEGCLVAC